MVFEVVVDVDLRVEPYDFSDGFIAGFGLSFLYFVILISPAQSQFFA